jgi:hypothetical protein
MSEKAVRKNLLTEYDNAQVDRLLKGEIGLEDIPTDRANYKGIKAVYEAKLEYERLGEILRKHNAGRKAKLRKAADAFLETANKWKDKKAGVLYMRETMERNIRDIVPNRSWRKGIIATYFTPVHKNGGKADESTGRISCAREGTEPEPARRERAIKSPEPPPCSFSERQRTP